MHFKKTFTLVETLVVSVIIGVVLTTCITLYFKMIDVRVEVQAKQSLMQNTNALMERLNILIKDYTIDYEEYFNRKMYGCDSTAAATAGDLFTWSVGANAYCDQFTHFGNVWANTATWKLYHCSSSSLVSNTNSDAGWNALIRETNMAANQGCWATASSFFGWNNLQAYGQYSRQFKDVRSDADGQNWAVRDPDDVDRGLGPKAIWDQNNVQELYLISKDWTQRLILRRALLGSGDFDNSWVVGDSDVDMFYGLQMLKLRGFDAGQLHDFTNTTAANKGLYDGVIETWACDASSWFVCGGSNINYPWMTYNLPNSINDGWVSVFPSDITIVNWSMSISPSTLWSYAWADDAMQINPSITFRLKNKLYGWPWSWQFNPQRLNSYELEVDTTFNVKNTY